jgi:HK97 family phage major capsid protein
MTRDGIKALFREIVKEGGFDVDAIVKRAVDEARKAAAEEQAKQSTEWMAKLVQARGKSPEDLERDKNEKGLNAARIIRALAVGRGSQADAVAFADKTWGKDHDVSKALAAGDSTAGGFLLSPQFSSDLIELLRPASVVRRMRPTMLPMPQGQLSIPKLTAGSTATYTGENQNIVSSQQTTGMLNLVWKKLAALVPISNDLLRFASINADMMVRDDVVAGIATREDAGFIRDDGTVNTPKGLRFQVPAANTFAANGTVNLANVTTDLGQAVLRLLNGNSRMLRPGWLFAPRTLTFLMSIRDGNGNYAFRPELLAGNLHGFPFATTTQIPVNLGAGTESEVYLVDFADAVIAESDQVMVDASPNAAYFDSASGAVQSAFSRDQSVIRAIARHDFGMRHDESVAVITAVLWI